MPCCWHSRRWPPILFFFQFFSREKAAHTPLSPFPLLFSVLRPTPLSPSSFFYPSISNSDPYLLVCIHLSYTAQTVLASRYFTHMSPLNLLLISSLSSFPSSFSFFSLSFSTSLVHLFLAESQEGELYTYDIGLSISPASSPPGSICSAFDHTELHN